MVKTLLIGAALIILTACDHDRYTRPIPPVPHGQAVKTNMAAHIISPVPPAIRPDVVDGTRPALSIDAYRKNEVPEPSREDAAASTAAVNQ